MSKPPRFVRFSERRSGVFPAIEVFTHNDAAVPLEVLEAMDVAGVSRCLPLYDGSHAIPFVVVVGPPGTFTRPEWATAVNRLREVEMEVIVNLSSPDEWGRQQADSVS